MPPTKVFTQPSTVDEWIEARKADPSRFTFASNGDLIAAPVEAGNIEKRIILTSKVKAPKEAIDKFFEERSAKIKLAEDDFIAKKHMLHALMIRYKEAPRTNNNNGANMELNGSNENSNNNSSNGNASNQSGGDGSNSENSNSNSEGNTNDENSNTNGSLNSNFGNREDDASNTSNNSENSLQDVMGFMNQKVAMTLRQKLNDPVQVITKDDIVYANLFVKQAEQALVLAQGKRYVDSVPGMFQSNTFEYRDIHLDNRNENRKIPDPVYILQHNTFPYEAFWVTQEVNNQLAIQNMVAEEESSNNSSTGGGGETPEEIRAKNARKFSIIRSRMRAKAMRNGM